MRNFGAVLIIALLTGGVATGDLAAGDAVDAARAYRQEHGAEILAEFVELLRLPNVAADLEAVERNAVHLGKALERRGVAVELLRLEGAPPIVFGALDAARAERTLTFYVHYDGQPVDESQWSSSPWEPVLLTAAREEGGTERPMPRPGEPIDPEWRLYARSAGDDKAPIPAILGALDAMAAAGLAPTSNLRFFFEGEEEAGSRHLEEYLKKYGERLDTDVWLICDGPVHQSRQAQLVFGVRGITGFDITVYGATRYLHSGHYGNWAPNPAMLLAQLLASMKDGEGRVLIPGFYDSTVPISDAERSVLRAAPDYDQALREELGLAATEADNALLLERLMVPSLNVRGFVSAAVGGGARNVIPPQATASVDIRLAKGNDPTAMLDLVERHIRDQGFHIVRDMPDDATRMKHPRIARVTRRHGYPAARSSPDLPVMRRIRAAAERAADGEVISMPTMGGSLPLYLFTELLNSPVVIVPIANHDDNQHAPDENLRLANLWYGIDLMAALFAME